MVITDDVSIVVAGEAGQGIQSIESLLTSLAKKSSYHVFATKEYMSRVRGGCNSTEIRISCKPLGAWVDRIDILVPLIPEAMAHLGGRVTARTAVIGEKEAVDSVTHDLPLSALAADAGGPIYSNTVAVGALCALLHMDRDSCARHVGEFYERKGADIVERNVKAFGAGYDRGIALRKEVAIDICTDPAMAEHIMLTGAESVALGAIAGGCTYVCAYPMSPGTTVLTAMAQYSRSFDILVEQVEDEIGVANMALGAWYAGARALVTTSGGGFALMGEAMSLAGGTETPFVVHVAQRPGPATGLPTRTEQGDLGLALHAGHGDFLRIVLAPGDLEEGYRLTRKAFDVADRCQSPVVILTDQYFVDSYYTVRPFAVAGEAPVGHVVETDEGYRRYALGSRDGISPRGIPGRGRGIVCADSDEHDEAGYITEDAAVRKAMVEKRLAKVRAARRDAEGPTLIGPAAYETLVVGWGSVKGPVVEAMRRIADDRLAFLHFAWVHPLPEGVRERLAAARTIIDVEGNATGQFADLLERETGVRIEHRVLRYDGFQFTVEDLVERISGYLR